MERLRCSLPTYTRTTSGDLRLSGPVRETRNANERADLLGAVKNARVNILKARHPEVGKQTDELQIPPGVDLEKNQQQAGAMTPFEFYDKVRSRGDWDYKTKSIRYRAFGNYHFGLVVRSFGLPQTIALRGAGYYQIYVTHTSAPQWGKPWDIGNSSFGDDPNDQFWIKQGYKADKDEIESIYEKEELKGSLGSEPWAGKSGDTGKWPSNDSDVDAGSTEPLP